MGCIVITYLLAIFHLDKRLLNRTLFTSSAVMLYYFRSACYLLHRMYYPFTWIFRLFFIGYGYAVLYIKYMYILGIKPLIFSFFMLRLYSKEKLDNYVVCLLTVSNLFNFIFLLTPDELYQSLRFY